MLLTDLPVERVRCVRSSKKAFLDAHHRRTLLADEMGLGKAVQALSLQATEQAWPALIVVPPHLVRHWDKIPDFLDAGKSELPLFVHRPRNAGSIRAQSVAIPRSYG